MKEFIDYVLDAIRTVKPREKNQPITFEKLIDIFEMAKRNKEKALT